MALGKLIKRREKQMKPKNIFLIVLMLLTFLTGCASGTKAAVQKESSNIGQQRETKAAAKESKTETGEPADMNKEKMVIKVSSGETEILFALNESSACKSFYRQLPLTVPVENYSNNEKIFQPPKKLDCSSVQEGDCPVGSIAYFSPWNNICMYYGNAPRYSGLYVMGKAVKGAGQIGKLSGKIKIEAVK